MKLPVDVSENGAVILGDEVVCDGHTDSASVRVQTHVHSDHMSEFERSKGALEKILCTEATRALLVAEFNADLKHRPGLIGLRYNEPYQIANGSVTLVSSGHMLGSAQVLVTAADGTRLGYSGDLQWPADEVIKVDYLVVDSTYGSPYRRRKYSQDEVNKRFIEIASRAVNYGPLHIKAYRGTAQRALHLLCGNILVPILASSKFAKELNVYRNFGYAIDPIHILGTSEASTALESARYIRFYGMDETPKVGGGTEIILSGFMSDPADPVRTYSAHSIRIAMSDHADFDGIMSYIEESGARVVVTDNTRNHGIELAMAIRERLGIDAHPSTNFLEHRYGRAL